MEKTFQKRIVPVKNVSNVLIDVKKPNFDYSNLERTAKLNLSQIPRYGRSRARSVFYLATALVGAVFIFGGVFVFISAKGAREFLASRSEKIAGNFSSSINSLRSFKLNEASQFFKENSSDLDEISEFFGKREIKVLLGALGEIVPRLKDAAGILSEITKLNIALLGLSDTLADLEVNGFGYFRNDGAVLIQKLETVQSLLREINSKMEKVRNSMIGLKEFSAFFDRFDQAFASDYLKYSSDLYAADKFLSGLLGVLKSEDIKHVALFFQNPAEIRPAGGFIGSYGDLTIKNGQMVNLEVQDIYWPDHPMNFKLKVIPPEPLWGLTKDWGARDANWFFDFPTSARTVIGFLESSKIYEEKGIKFEGAIALNINVLESILDFVGPIELSEYKLTIDRSNFLSEIQREVETGRDKRAGRNPKRILGVLTPIILERISNLSSEKKSDFIKKLGDHLKFKDIMFYAKDPYLASFLNKENVDGAVYSLPSNFWGSYLAVVNANVAGGKSDAFIKEFLDVKIDIDTDGGVFTDLTVTRSHEGQKEKDPWWRATNKDFIQIFTNPGSSLFSLKGNDFRAAASQSGYDGYSANPDLNLIEKTKIYLTNYNAWSMEAFGKKVFGMWLYTPAGRTKELNLRYQTPAASQVIIGGGQSFKFIFERQSGVKSNLKVRIGAPLGYVWEETRTPVFTYESDNPEKRVIFDLVLKKQAEN